MSDKNKTQDAAVSKHESGQGGGESSNTSPLEGPVRFQSITGSDDDMAGSYQSTDTARGSSPEHLAPANYGAISSTSSSQQHDQSSSTQRPGVVSPLERSRVDRTERSTEASSARQRAISPDRGRSQQKSKKPAMHRRISSSLQGPHKGQEFSVDDDVTEVEEDLAGRQAAMAVASSGFGTLRRKPSTLRRRTPQAQQQQSLPRVDSSSDNIAQMESSRGEPVPIEGNRATEPQEEGLVPGEEDNAEEEDDEEEDTLSDTESFTLKDRQEAINETHPFGIRIWKPALYKKSRSVQRTAEGDIHSIPGGRVSNWLWLFNMLWTLIFGWWLALAALLGAVACFCCGFAPSAICYGRVLWGLSGYLFYPFGKFVRLEQDEAYAEEDEGEGRSISEYEQWQSGELEDGRLFFGPTSTRSLIGRRRSSLDSANETDSLLDRSGRGGQRSGRQSYGSRNKRRLFGRGEWSIGRVIFFIFFYGLITPLLLFVSGVCWLMVFWIPMGKVTMILFYHLRRHPLALAFEDDSTYFRSPDAPSSSVLLCTYRAVGLKYWKYTVDGTNIFFINLMGVVLFVIFDYWVLEVALGLHIGLTNPAFVFTLALFSIIPLAYFIGQAVASISAQSSMGLGAAINAFFSTIVEVFLYCVALSQGKGQLVEGSIIGSIFAGILFLPGISMCFGAIKRKTQRFNAKSAGVTSTMLLFAVIAAFGPTLFYQIYGTHELNCLSCVDTHGKASSRDCRRCYFSQVPALDDRFYLEAVRPYCWFAATFLFLSYVIGLWFTLRTHAAVIWNVEVEEKKLHTDFHAATTGGYQGLAGSASLTRQTSGPGGDGRTSIRDSQLYKRILGQSLEQVGLEPRTVEQPLSNITSSPNGPLDQPQTLHLVPPKSSGNDVVKPDTQIPRYTEENRGLVREVAEVAAAAAAIAARDTIRHPRKASGGSRVEIHQRPFGHGSDAVHVEDEAHVGEGSTHQSGGHDAPNWSRLKSSLILLGATLLYAIIAEILVDTVDVVLDRVDIDEKFLGITLIALVPNTTEFLNAISFAMNGNIALSMEIGSAYALQVCLLQLPALVLFSSIHGNFVDPGDLADYTFPLIFPQWDMVTVILCVFLLSYMYGEGKSNYFKGSILILSYLVVIAGFYLSGMTDNSKMGMSRFDTMTADGYQTFKTIGRRSSGIAFPS